MAKKKISTSEISTRNRNLKHFPLPDRKDYPHCLTNSLQREGCMRAPRSRRQTRYRILSRPLEEPVVMDRRIVVVK